MGKKDDEKRKLAAAHERIERRQKELLEKEIQETTRRELKLEAECEAEKLIEASHADKERELKERNEELERQWKEQQQKEDQMEEEYKQKKELQEATALKETLMEKDDEINKLAAAHE